MYFLLMQRKVEFLQDKLNDRNNEVLKLHGSLTKRGIVPPHASMDNSYTTCTDKLDRIGKHLTYLLHKSLSVHHLYAFIK